MKSSSGAHFIALDHVRALAAFMVFTWHFTHGTAGQPVPFEGLPALPPFALLDEGHTGVALFMTLSGYLFARLLDGKAVNYRAFVWNRVLRLLPLLALVVLVAGLRKVAGGDSAAAYAGSVLQGLLLPTLPNGGWSITVEFHFYLLLPLLLWLLRRSNFALAAVVLAALALRALLHAQRGEVQTLAYWTLVGRIDQFALGMLMFHWRARIAGRHLLALAVMAGFSLFYWFFDRLGGFYGMPSYPSPSALWIVLPTVEGLAYALLIAWYDSSFALPTGGWSRFVARIGDYSYFIYLFHFFVVFEAARLVHTRVMDISNFYLACAWSLLCFLLLVPLGYLSHRFVESPFLKMRRRYIK